MPVIVCDEVPARMALARELTYLVPGIEYRLQAGIGRRRQVTLVTVVPEPEVALVTGQVAGFGKGGCAHRDG